MRWLVRFGFATIFLLSFAAVAQQSSIRCLDGSTITPAEIDATVTRLMKAAEVPGVAIAIIDHGEVAFVKAYGVRDTQNQVTLTPDNDFCAHLSAVPPGWQGQN